MQARPTLYVMVGLPAAGKTTRAREIEIDERALRLTPDEWMIALFDHPLAGGKRDVLEGRFVVLAMQVLRLGMNVVLDFGVWSRDERSALRWLASQEGARCELVFMEVDEESQRRVVEARFTSDPGSSFELRHYTLDEFRRVFQAPDREELEGGDLDAPPDGFDTWGAWAAERWPSFVP